MMATLHVRNIPDEVYERVKQLAARQRRSLSEEVAVLLENAVEAEEQRRSQAELLAEINRVRETRTWSPDYPDSTELLREDRAR
jgi:plasmid stability protein